MNKKGFTLVELLSVIAILAILVIIALPNVLSMYNNARKSSFITELKSVYTAAEEKWITDSFSGSGTKAYAHCSSGNCDNELKLSGRDDLEYYIEFNSKGKIVKYYAKDNSFQYSYEGLDLKKNDINEVQSIPEVTNGKYVQITCAGGKVSSPPPASIDYYLMKKPLASTDNTNSNVNYLRTTILKKDIEKLSFSDSLGGHTPNGTDCWDVSYGSNGSVLAWATDADNNGLYELTIGANGDVYVYSGYHMFSYLTSLTEITGIENLNTSMVTNMSAMFMNDKILERLDLSSLDTSNVTDMMEMFDLCNNLKYLNISGFDTKNVTSMYDMFYGCFKLETLNLSHFDTTSLINAHGMFGFCRNLVNLDLSSFNISSATNISSMFYECNNIETLDLSHFNTQNVSAMSKMFYNCNKLKTIYVSDSFVTNNVTSGDNMFGNCVVLKGGNGTEYDSSNPKDYTYAHIDGGESNPGYFTRK